MTHTHTVATLEVSRATYEEIADRLAAAGYDVRAMDANGGVAPFALDMTGIGLVRDSNAEQPDPDQANMRQVGGAHYGLKSFQHWDMVDLFKLDYFQGQITKYVMRWRDKNGIIDLEKGQHFLEKYIALEKKKANTPEHGSA